MEAWHLLTSRSFPGASRQSRVGAEGLGAIVCSFPAYMGRSACPLRSVQSVDLRLVLPYHWGWRISFF